MSRGVNERQNFLASEQKQANNDSDWISELYKEDLNYKNKLLHTIKKGPSTFYAFVSTILLLILLIYILPTTIQEHYELYDYTCGYLLSQLIRSLTNKFVFLGLAYGFTMMLYLSSRKTVYSGFTIATITSLIVFYFWYSDNSFFAYPNWGDNPAGYHPFRNCLS